MPAIYICWLYNNLCIVKTKKKSGEERGGGGGAVNA